MVKPWNPLMTSTLLYFLFALLLLVTFHEFGHFLVARLCGVKVLRFSFGFGHILAKYTSKKGTEYAWSLWPLGGYVKMLDENEGEVAPEDKPYAFNNQPIWKRALIVLAGPFFNFIFAFFALWLVWMIGIKSLAPIIKQVEPNGVAAKAGVPPNTEIIELDGEKIRSWRDFQYTLMAHIGSDDSVTIQVKSLSNNQVTSHQLPLAAWEIDPKRPNLIKSLGIRPFIPPVLPIIAHAPADMPAAKAGIKPKDLIIAINGMPIHQWDDMVNFVKDNPNKLVQVTVSRGEKHYTYSVKTTSKEIDGQLIGVLGVQAKTDQWPAKYLRIQKKGPIAAMGQALEQTWDLSSATILFIGRLITGKMSLDTISGPVGIAQGAGNSGRSGIVYYLFFLAVVSVSLGVLNLLPIPMLDGGHLFFYVIEGIRGRPVSPAFQIALTYVGLGLLFMLMGLAVTNDLARIFS